MKQKTKIIIANCLEREKGPPYRVYANRFIDKEEYIYKIASLKEEILLVKPAISSYYPHGKVFKIEKLNMKILVKSVRMKVYDGFTFTKKNRVQLAFANLIDHQKYGTKRTLKIGRNWRESSAELRTLYAGAFCNSLFNEGYYSAKQFFKELNQEIKDHKKIV